MARATTIVGRNTASGKILIETIERIERIREQIKALRDEEGAILAQRKAEGFSPTTIRTVLKRRGMKPADLEEAQAELDMYLHAIGMQTETPLFRSVGLMKVDTSARDAVIEAFKLLVPTEGEIIVKIGAQPVRLWRDDTGTPHAEDLIEKSQPASRPAGSVMPARAGRTVPDVDEPGAVDLGRDAYRANQPITSNPFPWDDKRRAAFDRGWRMESGTDGMGPEEE